jgi:hypothetical protein
MLMQSINQFERFEHTAAGRIERTCVHGSAGTVRDFTA